MIEYYQPTPEFPFSFKQVFPGRKAGLAHEPSLFRPPPHYHWFQDEHFKVEAGRGIWYLWTGETVRLKKGDEIMVPMWKWHWFEADPDSEEPFSVLYGYNKEYTAMEARFFKNQFGYMNDCHRAGVNQSIFQLMVFCMHFWMPIAIISIGPESFKFAVNSLLMLVIGSIGEFLLGYQVSYPEYYSEGKKTE